MKLLNTVGDFFALDIGTTAIRIVQLSHQGHNDAWTLVKYGYAPVDPKISTSDAAEDQRRLGEVIMTALGQSGITTRDVVVGIPSNKTFATVVDLPKMTTQELKVNVKYQAEQYIPMPINEVKLDWALLGDSPTGADKSEILLTSVANSYNEARLDMLEGIGLNVVATEPDSIAMLRPIFPQNTTGAAMVFDMGYGTSDLVVTKDGAPRLVRSVPVGLQALIKSAMSNLNIEYNQAEQFILKFGLAPDRLEGQVIRAVEGALDQFIAEINKSITFFQNRYTGTQVSTIYIAGYGAAIPLYAEYINQKTGVSTVLANPWQKVQMNATDKEKLQTISTQFDVALGLAQRTKVL
ncbi:MAG: type IV pilus assembly protein PilM [Patescibacteria group bacterium]